VRERDSEIKRDRESETERERDRETQTDTERHREKQAEQIRRCGFHFLCLVQKCLIPI
jgi:hypothetical protein